MSDVTQTTQATPAQTTVHRRTPFSARGEPRVWLMAMAVVVCLALIVGIIGLIVVRGSATFWQGPIDEVRLQDGSVFLGVPSVTETYQPQPDELERIEQARADGQLDNAHAFTKTGEPVRRRYFVGNRDLGQESFRWVPLWEVASIEQPKDVVLVERDEWGPFLGRVRTLRAVTDEDPNPTGQEFKPESVSDRELQSAIDTMEARRAAIARIDRTQIPRLQNQLRQLEWKLKAAHLNQERRAASADAPPAWLWWGAMVGCIVAVGGVLGLRKAVRHTNSGSRVPVAILACLLLATGSLAYLWLERPGSHKGMSDDQVTQIEQQVEAERNAILNEQSGLLTQLDDLREEDNRYRIIIEEPSLGRISPVSRSAPDDPMRLSQVVRIVPANDLSFSGRIGVYLSRWWEFLSTNPREGATAGGVYPVIVGTVTLTVLLTISVVPLGVIAALYLREYAKQGVVTSIIRIAINNLAGVPSIVYGMFGLGFFCYTLGGYIDEGPTEPTPVGSWWGLVGVLFLAILIAGACGLFVRRSGDRLPDSASRLISIGATVGWLVAVVLAFWAISSTPYFHGFFEAKLPEQTTFGGRGILWASLTLALLTLPVVIVATEEAIAAVPGSMREGSYGCGASKWQTIRKIVLPSAMPGILTGAILAMARGAGEVAPLMLVGAVNLAPALPVSTDAPFLHGDRTFMHLGFHIYTLGFQSPDSEATAPLVWTTTLLLITIVLLLNLIAIIVRARLRSRMATSAV